MFKPKFGKPGVKAVRTERKKLIAKLDKWFSLYVRLSHSNIYGICQCVTCGSRNHYKKMHAGHFIGRQNLRVRWLPENVHPQCVSCNTFHEGRKSEYTEYLKDRYGEKNLELIIVSSKVNSIPENSVLQFLCDRYKASVKELLKETHANA